MACLWVGEMAAQRTHPRLRVGKLLLTWFSSLPIISLGSHPITIRNENLSSPFLSLVQPLVATQRLPEAKLLPTLGM